MVKRWFAVGLGVLATLLAGCSSFGKHWRDMETRPAAADALAGRWQGEWRSEPSGHSGKLRCLIRPLPGEPGRYQATFQAKWMTLFTFEQPAVLSVEPTPTGVRFSGESDLGSWGVYRYDGSVEGAAFHATYQTANDHGTFRMTRLD